MSKEEIELAQLQHIINYENNILEYHLNRKLSVFHITSKLYLPYGKKLRRGFIACHGHNHSNDVISKIKFINFWFYVDARIDTFPDYIADVTDNYDMFYFPSDYFSCVLSL